MIVSVDDLLSVIHATLRQWHEDTESPMESLLLVKHLLREQMPMPNVTATTVARELVAEQIDHMRNGTEETQGFARLLICIYYDQMMVKEFAYESGLSRFQVDRRRERALKQISAAIWAQETITRTAHQATLEKFLPRPNYDRLFGVEETKRDLFTALTEQDDANIVSVVGLGGLGKTSLANFVCRQLSDQLIFDHIFWFKAPSDAPHPHPPEYVYTETLGAVNVQLTGQNVAASLAELEANVGYFLRQHRCLVVVDNIESADLLNYLVAKLNDLAPSKILLTSRANYLRGGRVNIIRLDELSEAESLKLLRHTAENLAIADFADVEDEDLRPIFEMTGGNPYALKLVVGLAARGLALDTILSDMRRGTEGDAWDMFNHIYWLMWHGLAADAKRTLKTLLTAGTVGLTLKQLQAGTKLDTDAQHDAIKALTQHALLELRGTLFAPRYGIHQLTSTFLDTEIIRREAL